MGLELRIAILFALMAVVAAIERWRYGSQATRWHEYGFVFLSGLLGSVVGVLNDQFTCTLSPDYFVLGKGLSDGPWFRLEVARLGYQAGFGPGAVCGGVLLMARSGRDAAYPHLLRLALTSMGGAVLLLSPLCGLWFWLADPVGYRTPLAEIMPVERVDRFLGTWGLHAGLYLGALLGLAIACVRVRRQPLLPDA